MQATATQSNVDYAVQAKSALAAVERLTAEIEAVPNKTSMCREKWRDYGAALLAQRVLMPSNQQFGQWVKEHGLDAGLASHHSVRADAMWLAEQYDIVRTSYDGNSHHPQEIRKQCRDAGHDWAGETKHQKERKAKSVRTKAKRQSYSWIRVAQEEGLNAQATHNRARLKPALATIDPDPDLFTAAKETRLREVCALYLAQKQPEATKGAVEEARATVPESKRAQFDKAVAKAVNAEIARLQTQFYSEIESRVAPAVEAERARAHKKFEESQQELQRFIARRDGIKQALTKKELQFVLNCLHPDRAPDDRKTKFAEAFHIVKRLQPYVDSFE